MSNTATAAAPKVVTLSVEGITPTKRKPGRPKVYTDAERAERARAATKRSQQRRINRNAADLDKVQTVLTTINLARLSKEDRSLVADALQIVVDQRAQYTVKDVDVPDTEWDADAAPIADETPAEA